MTSHSVPASGSERLPLMIVDAAACSGCGLCVVACKDEHVGQAQEPWTDAQADVGQSWIRVQAVERGQAPRVRVTHLPMACQHCADAPCMTVCPEDAIQRREDGLVWIDPAICTGCGDCVAACPYDAVSVDEELGVAQKCTGCAHRVDVGQLPRCVEICPHDVFRLTGAEPAGSDPTEEPASLKADSGLKEAVLWTGLPRPYLSGCVVDKTTDEVLADVRVVVTNSGMSSVAVGVTDAFGNFQIDGLDDAQDYTVTVEHYGRVHEHGPVRLVGWADIGEIGV